MTLAASLVAAVALAAAPQKITLDVQRADIHNVLRMLAEVGKINIVAGDEVSGKVTIRLRNVPWTEALDMICRLSSLGVEKRGNIVRVAPLKTLSEEAEQRRKLKDARNGAAPLKTEIVPVNYARAADMVPHVKMMLTERGTVTHDERTNVLIIRDVDPDALP